MPRTRFNPLARFRGTDQPWVTWSIMALCVVVFALQNLPGSTITSQFLYTTQFPWVATEPWRMITSVFLHGSIPHIVLNMLSLFLFGPLLERTLGRIRYLSLYLISGLGGSVAVLLLDPNGSVLGASGAIFGVVGAVFVIQRKFGGNTTSLLVVIGLNLVIGFVPGGGISWQAHVGGLIVGAAVALVYLRTRRRDQRPVQVVAVAGIAAALVAITAISLVVSALA